MAHLSGVKPKFKSAKEITQSFPHLVIFYKRMGRKVLVGSWSGLGAEFEKWQKEMRYNNYVIYGAYDLDPEDSIFDY